MERKLFAADVEGIESIGAVGAVFEEVFFGFGELFAGLVFAEAVASAADTCVLDGEDKVFIVPAVEERHEPLLSGKGVVDEKILLVVVHRVSEVHGLDAPAVPLELLYHVIVEVLVVDGIVGAEGRCIVIIGHGLVAVRGVIAAEVLDESRYLAVKLDVNDTIKCPNVLYLTFWGHFIHWRPFSIQIRGCPERLLCRASRQVCA